MPPIEVDKSQDELNTEAIKALGLALWKLTEAKPGDRSELDRHYQILITDLEKLTAIAEKWLG